MEPDRRGQSRQPESEAARDDGSAGERGSRPGDPSTREDAAREAATIVRERFGIEGEATPLPGEFDRNFRIRGRPVGSAAQGRTDARAEGPASRAGQDGPHGNRVPRDDRVDFVLKLSPVSRRPVLDLATSLLRHLEPATLSAQVPRVLAPLPPTPSPRSTPAPPPFRHDPAPEGRVLGPVPFQGRPHVACAVAWVPGVPFAALPRRPMEVLAALGRLLAELNLALADFDHPELDRDFAWRMETAPATIRDHLPDLARGRDLVAATLERALRRLGPVRSELPRCVIHNDANDYNVIATPSLGGARLAGLIDFGDAARGWRVSEVAVAATYAMLELPDPIAAACAVARGYAAVAPPTAAECRAVVPLVALRLCLSVCVQAREMARQPDNEYLAVSQKGAWRLLRRLAGTDWRLAEFRIREAAGLTPNPARAAVERWIRRAPERSPVMPPELLARPATVDLSVENPDLPWPAEGEEARTAIAGAGGRSAQDRGVGAGPGDAGAATTLARWVEARMAAAGATVGVGRWGEARLLYDAPGFREEGNDGEEARTIHLGLDLFAPAGTPVLAPLAGEVAAVADNDLPRDYGPTVILRHRAEPAKPSPEGRPAGALAGPADPSGPMDSTDSTDPSHPADSSRPASAAGTTSASDSAATSRPRTAAVFHTLYGHLDRATLRHLAPGQPVRPGQVIGWLGDASVNGGWPPHLHLQVIALGALDDDGAVGAAAAKVPASAGSSPDRDSASTDSASPSPANFPGVALERLRSVWEAVLPDPAPLSGLDPATATAIDPADRPRARKAKLARRRSVRMGPSLSLSYRDPLHIVRGHGAWLHDDAGRGYLDTVNNVPHVGHGNARVAEAIARQSRILNTNTRYLHEEIVALADELLAHFPTPAPPVPANVDAIGNGPPASDPLEVVFLVCSGSEANELALRMARCHTGREGVVCVKGGYHGNTTGLVEVSQYKFDGPGGRGVGPGVAVAAMPDPYRGKHRGGGDGGREGGGRGGTMGRLYADEVARAAAGLNRPGGPGVAAFIVEPILSCGGQIEPPPGYLAAAFRHIREGGGVCIADEVQVGFGRVGDAFWGFELQDVVPDIVTLGKPMGNGHPVAAVVTTRAIADSFANGMEYFSTFGGNPVSCAAARAVLAEIRERKLQERARRVGNVLLKSLRELARRHPVIGDVRGRGLFLGIELVHDRESREPFPRACNHLVNRARQLGVLLSADGPGRNVIKIKPPLVFGKEDASLLVRTLDRVLGEMTGSWER